MPAAHARRRLALAALASAGALVVGLSGCTTDAPEPTPSPSASADAPIFASDEEALAAAEEAYTAYLIVVDEISHNGGDGDLAVLEKVASAEYIPDLQNSIEQLRTSGNHSTGATRFDGMKLVEQTQVGGFATVSTYVCLDVSEVRNVDGSGTDITSSERVERRALVADFISVSPGSGNLVVNGSEPWTGNDFC